MLEFVYNILNKTQGDHLLSKRFSYSLGFDTIHYIEKGMFLTHDRRYYYNDSISTNMGMVYKIKF